MRFRSLNHLPTFSGYLSGLSFSKTAAYGLASGLGRALSSPERIRATGERIARRFQLRLSLMRHGILPYPGETKVTQVPRREAAVTAIRVSVPAAPAPTVPPETTWRPAPKPIQIAPRVKQVIPARSVCANPYQARPAAVSNTGGLRGSLATRRRR